MGGRACAVVHMYRSGDNFVVCVCGGVCAMVHTWRSGDNFVTLIVFCFYVGSGDQTQAVKHAQPLSLLSHLIPGPEPLGY